MESIDKVKNIVKSLDKHKAEDILAIGIREITTLADYFVIATAKSTTAVKAVTNYLEEDLAEVGLEPTRKEGIQASRWNLLDYGDVIVHIFLDEAREFYNLERLWSDGEKVDISNFLED